MQHHTEQQLETKEVPDGQLTKEGKTKSLESAALDGII